MMLEWRGQALMAGQHLQPSSSKLLTLVPPYGERISSPTPEPDYHQVFRMFICARTFTRTKWSTFNDRTGGLHADIQFIALSTPFGPVG